MRIISGKFKKRKLFTVEGNSTRPTSDYHRELLFSCYTDYEGKRVLDLYAGTGSFGLECFSRGADWVDFVEFSSKAIGVLLKNIALVNMGESCHVYRKKVIEYIKSCTQIYDVIYLDPPYDKDLVNPTLHAIFASDILAEDAVLIVERATRETLDAAFAPYVFNQKVGKTTSFEWLETTKK